MTYKIEISRFGKVFLTSEEYEWDAVVKAYESLRYFLIDDAGFYMEIVPA